MGIQSLPHRKRTLFQRPWTLNRSPYLVCSSPCRQIRLHQWVIQRALALIYLLKLWNQSLHGPPAEVVLLHKHFEKLQHQPLHWTKKWQPLLDQSTCRIVNTSNTARNRRNLPLVRLCYKPTHNSTSQLMFEGQYKYLPKVLAIPVSSMFKNFRTDYY